MYICSIVQKYKGIVSLLLQVKKVLGPLPIFKICTVSGKNNSEQNLTRSAAKNVLVRKCFLRCFTDPLMILPFSSKRKTNCSRTKMYHNAPLKSPNLLVNSPHFHLSDQSLNILYSTCVPTETFCVSTLH